MDLKSHENLSLLDRVRVLESENLHLLNENRLIIQDNRLLSQELEVLRQKPPIIVQSPPIIREAPFIREIHEERPQRNERRRDNETETAIIGFFVEKTWKEAGKRLKRALFEVWRLKTALRRGNKDNKDNKGTLARNKMNLESIIEGEGEEAGFEDYEEKRVSKKSDFDIPKDFYGIYYKSPHNNNPF